MVMVSSVGLLVCLVAGSLYLSGWLVVAHAVPKDSITHTLPLPVRLKIPRINLDTSIEEVGLAPGGAMDAPSGPLPVALYDRGPRPGEKGSAVIAGHYGWKNGHVAAFDQLHLLQKGDLLSVEDATGKSTTFVVREIRVYDATADATDIFTSPNGSHLNLITCGGSWNEGEKTYAKRTVVFTDIVE